MRGRGRRAAARALVCRNAAVHLRACRNAAGRRYGLPKRGWPRERAGARRAAQLVFELARHGHEFERRRGPGLLKLARRGAVGLRISRSRSYCPRHRVRVAIACPCSAGQARPARSICMKSCRAVTIKLRRAAVPSQPRVSNALTPDRSSCRCSVAERSMPSTRTNTRAPGRAGVARPSPPAAAIHRHERATASPKRRLSAAPSLRLTASARWAAWITATEGGLQWTRALAVARESDRSARRCRRGPQAVRRNLSPGNCRR